MRSLYQWVYDTKYRNYGEMSHNHCPGVRLYPEYATFIRSPIIDLGCGTGDTVRYLRERGYEAQGVDWIILKNDMMVGDILEFKDYDKYDTVLCMDVLEHLSMENVHKLLKNMEGSKLQVFSISNTPSIIVKDKRKINVHVTDIPFGIWDIIIRKYFNIIKRKKIRDMQMLYLCEGKR